MGTDDALFPDGDDLFSADPLQPRGPSSEHAATVFAVLRDRGSMDLDQLLEAVRAANRAEGRKPFRTEEVVALLRDFEAEHRVRRTTGHNGQPRFRTV